jgi:hypothetical protein
MQAEVKGDDWQCNVRDMERSKRTFDRIEAQLRDLRRNVQADSIIYRESGKRLASRLRDRV